MCNRVRITHIILSLELPKLKYRCRYKLLLNKVFSRQEMLKFPKFNL